MSFQPQTHRRAFASQMKIFSRNARIRFISILGVAIATPLFVQFMHKQLGFEGSSFLIDLAVNQWVWFYLGSIIFIQCMNELFSSLMIRTGALAIPSHIPAIVYAKAKRVGLQRKPRIVYLPNRDMLNAAATRSFRFGNKVLLMGNFSALSYEQQEAVIAHEIAHLAMGDVRAMHFARGLVMAMYLINRLLFLAFLVSLPAAIFAGTVEVAQFLFVTWLVTRILSRAVKKEMLAYSRICEYRADAIAVHLTTPAHRRHLISAIEKVRELAFMVRDRKEGVNEKLKAQEEHGTGTHPTLMQRVKSLDLIRFFKAELV